MAREMDARFAVDADAASARTLDPAFYTDPSVRATARERVFAQSWQGIDDLDGAASPGADLPPVLLLGGGRYSVENERGVHHFHRPLCAAMAD